jgi:hypothetical protein
VVVIVLAVLSKTALGNTDRIFDVLAGDMTRVIPTSVRPSPIANLHPFRPVLVKQQSIQVNIAYYFDPESYNRKSWMAGI